MRRRNCPHTPQPPFFFNLRANFHSDELLPLWNQSLFPSALFDCRLFSNVLKCAARDGNLARFAHRQQHRSASHCSRNLSMKSACLCVCCFASVKPLAASVNRICNKVDTYICAHSNDKTIVYTQVNDYECYLNRVIGKLCYFLELKLPMRVVYMFGEKSVTSWTN